MGKGEARVRGVVIGALDFDCLQLTHNEVLQFTHIEVLIELSVVIGALDFDCFC